MKKLAAFATTTVLLAVAGTMSASAREAEPRDDHGTAVSTRHVRSVTTEAGDDHPQHPGRHGHHRRTQVEPGDDHGAEVEPGDDHGTEVEPGDDHGAEVEPGDDHGTEVEPGDDHGTEV